MHKLAVIIPAYKSTYLEKALLSLAQQTNKNFTVYIGDDCSPENLQVISDRFSGLIAVRYHRFTNNIGGKELVTQWERCVQLKGGEEWIWIFSDDDEAESSCVAYFYKALEETGSLYDVYRFNTLVIDGNSAVMAETPASPRIQNPMELALNILRLQTGNSMPDHIFRYEKYKELNGFIHTKFAQAADWGSSISFSFPNGLYTIEGPRVRWRMSGQSISSVAGKRKSDMIFGHVEFLQWVSNKFTAGDAIRFNIPLHLIHEAIRYNFIYVTLQHYQGIPYGKSLALIKALGKIKTVSLYESIRLCLRVIYLQKAPGYEEKVRRFVRRMRGSKSRV